MICKFYANCRIITSIQSSRPINLLIMAPAVCKWAAAVEKCFFLKKFKFAYGAVPFTRKGESFKAVLWHVRRFSCWPLAAWFVGLCLLADCYWSARLTAALGAGLFVAFMQMSHARDLHISRVVVAVLNWRPMWLARNRLIGLMGFLNVEFKFLNFDKLNWIFDQLNWNCDKFNSEHFNRLNLTF